LPVRKADRRQVARQRHQQRVEPSMGSMQVVPEYEPLDCWSPCDSTVIRGR
jgi:hypothetical protein